MHGSRLRLIVAATAVVAQISAALVAPPRVSAAIATTLTMAATPNPAWSDQSVTVTATVSPNPGGGQVYIDGSLYAINPATGVASFTFTFQTAGLRQITGSFPGFGDYAASGPSSTNLQVNDHPVSLTLHVPASVGRGDSFNVTVDVIGNPPAGSGYVQVRDMTLGGLGYGIGSAALNGTSPLTIAIPGQLPGTYKLQASWTGTTYYTAAASSLVDLTVFDRPTTTTVTASPDPSKWGEPVNVQVVVSPPPGTGKQVVVKVDGSIVGQPTLNPNGVATISVVPGAPGAHTISAEFGSQANPTPPEHWAPSSDSEPQTVSSTPYDTTAPTGTVTINSGAALATSLPVGLTLNASDASGIVFTDISNDGVTWYSHPSNLTDYGWNLCDPDYGGTATDGTKTVYVRWRDPYGNTSATATDSILLDFFGPIGQVSIASGAGSVTSTSVNVAVPATDAGSSVSQVSLSNNGSAWTTVAYAPSVAWSLASGDGEKTVHVKWKDARGHWSDESTDTIVLDTTAPAGSALISGGATYAGSTVVTVAVAATDAISGLSQVALSNDGTTWTTRAYGANQAWTLAAGDGVKTVHVKWKDVAGNWSAVSSDTITLDTVAPTATAPTYAFVSGVGLSSTSTPTKFSWTGSDATSGVARYEAEISTDGGAYASISTSLLSATLTRNLASGHTYRLRVRAVDNAALTGVWVYGTTLTVTSYQETSSRITYTGTWYRPASSSYWGGYEKYAKTAGAKASFTFTGRAYALIGCVGPARGSVKVYVNGVLTQTVSTYAATTSCKRVLVTLSWSTAVSRKVSIVVSGTSGHPRVDLDAIVAAY
ncbi:MAG TPA: Ig-like domain-containing protein [Candidatus Limnocylindrales bacterium]|nr:Ig-like domain-containing protein [Candidatus Limnocylindrales bacterium]